LAVVVSIMTPPAMQMETTAASMLVCAGMAKAWYLLSNLI